MSQDSAIVRNIKMYMSIGKELGEEVEYDVDLVLPDKEAKRGRGRPKSGKPPKQKQDTGRARKTSTEKQWEYVMFIASQAYSLADASATIGVSPHTLTKLVKYKHGLTWDEFKRACFGGCKSALLNVAHNKALSGDNKMLEILVKPHLNYSASKVEVNISAKVDTLVDGLLGLTEVKNEQKLLRELEIEDGLVETDETDEELDNNVDIESDLYSMNKV